MNKTVISILLIITSLSLFAQNDVSVFEVNYNKAEKIVGMKLDDYLFIKTEEQSANFYMISAAGDLIDSYKTSRNIILLGTTSNRDEIRFYFTWKGTNRYSFDFIFKREKAI